MAAPPEDKGTCGSRAPHEGPAFSAALIDGVTAEPLRHILRMRLPGRRMGDASTNDDRTYQSWGDRRKSLDAQGATRLAQAGYRCPASRLA